MRVQFRWVAVTAALVLLSTLVSASPAMAQTGDTDGSIAIIKDDESPSNAEISVRLSEETPLPNVTRVAIARDDDFADALASGLIQANSPLLMVPQGGPVPDRVLQEIQRLGASGAIILGGSAAVSDAVAQQLEQAGLSIERRQGGSRFETAIAIADAHAADADTVILARAFGSDPNNASQGFADALAAGAMAADNAWPILLTETASLTPVTRNYIESHGITNVKIVGGTAAVSEAVADELRQFVGNVERIAGDSRAGTAVEIAKERGTETAADAARVVLVDGTSPEGFAGGFAAAAHAAFYDAPILLVDGIQVPPETEGFLRPGAAYAGTGLELEVTCVVHPLACDEGREDLGLVDYPLLDVDPPINSLVSPNQTITLTLSPANEGGNVPVTVKGSCLDEQQDLVTNSSGVATFSLGSFLGDGAVCGVEFIYGTGEDLIQQGFSYAVIPDAARPEGIGVASDIFAYGSVVPPTPAYVTDSISCSGPAGDVSGESSAYEARLQHEDFSVETFSVSSSPIYALPGDVCTAVADVPPGVSRVIWGVYSWSDRGLRNPLLLGNGTTAEFTFEELGADVTDVSIFWILETHDPDLGLPAIPADGALGTIFNPEGLPITCDGEPVGEGFVAVAPGASCDVASFVEGLGVLVVEPGRDLIPEPTAFFAAPTTPEITGVYTVVTDAVALGGAGSCEAAEELPYSTLTPGFTTPGAPSAFHTFFGFQDESIRFRVDSSTTSDEGGLDPTLTLYAPDGSEIAFNDDGDSGFNSRIDATLPAEGTYCLEVVGYGESTGDYLIVADPAPFHTDGGELSPQVPTQDFPIEVFTDEYLIIEMRSAGFAATDPVIELFDPFGNSVAFSDDEGGFPNSRIEFLVPEDGVYTLRASVYEDSYGPFTIEVSSA